LPNNWVFDAYDQNSGDIKLVVTAMLDDCNTSSRRMLQLTAADIPQVVKGIALFKLGPKSPYYDSGPNSGAATYLTTLFLAVALLVA